MMYREALRAAWFDMENLRGQYIILTDGNMHQTLIKKLIDFQMLVMSPITPHFCEHMWGQVLKNKGLIVKQKWPKPTKEVDSSLSRKYALLQSNLRTFRLDLDKFASPKKGSKDPPKKPTEAV